MASVALMVALGNASLHLYSWLLLNRLTTARSMTFGAGFLSLSLAVPFLSLLLALLLSFTLLLSFSFTLTLTLTLAFILALAFFLAVTMLCFASIMVSLLLGSSVLPSRRACVFRCKAAVVALRCTRRSLLIDTSSAVRPVTMSVVRALRSMRRPAPGLLLVGLVSVMAV